MTITEAELTLLTETGEEIDFDFNPFEDLDDGKDHKTHIINPPMNVHIWQPGMTPQEIVDIARFQGLEVTALCGYKFVPKRNPEKYHACEQCMTMAGFIMREDG